MASGSAIGLMDPAFFVGRKEIIEWLNATLCLNLQKIEQTASGAVACQLLDCVWPGSVPMAKVKWDAKSDYEFIQNYKILQRVFQRKKIERHIEVEKLIRAKYQDNFEFMQFMKRFVELNGGIADEYDPIYRREKSIGVRVSPITQGGSSAPSAPRAQPRSRPAGGVSKPKPTRTAATRRPANRNPAPSSHHAAAGADDALVAELEKKCDDLAIENDNFANEISSLQGDNEKINESLEQSMRDTAELKLVVDGLEKERDFYFGKLRDIEILLQSLEDESHKSLTDDIFKILYATEEEFVAVDEEEPLLHENVEQEQ
eukprot:TRINITY_DN74198_c1_g1_i1.p1 TRINITY_DN74198_c1_g1~~TRINITY_DN74198_c1_g1_i1.p1  ORF type:complete len:316 (-),score=123.41 TRINITY_DN74198_c1_g1_i1:227-1174(-)